MVGAGGVARAYFAELAAAFGAGPPPELEQAAALLVEAVAAGRTIFTFGNGASAALASHLATDLGKGTAADLGLPPAQASAPRVRIVSLADNAALLTAYGNDVDFEHVFVEQLRGLMQPGDVALGISASGSSPNVLRALEYARAHGGRTVALTGSRATWGALTPCCDVIVRAPLEPIDQIEDAHVAFGHVLMRVLTEHVRGGAG